MSRALPTVAASALIALMAQASAVAQERADEPARPDLLTFARGALFVGQTGLSSGSAGTALLAIDGNPYRLTLTRDDAGPVEFVYKLPALTTFDRFAIPAVVEQPGNVTFVRNVTVSGSATAPDSGYVELAAFELETHGPDETVTEAVPGEAIPVRWVRVRFENGINIEPGDEGRTLLWFSELIGNGRQDEVPLSTAFDGEWEMRLTERLDLRGEPLRLVQEGATLSGCYGDARITGSVNGSIARATGFDVNTERPVALVLVADGDDIHASVSVNQGRFGARTAVAVPELEATPCEELPPEPAACGTNVYVNFDFDSATIRPESEQVLADVYAALTAEGANRVTIVGHTSTEGSEEYNRDLSQRRARAVVDDLVGRGYAPATISATGVGESQPLLSPDADETSRELNRRVEISCE